MKNLLILVLIFTQVVILGQTNSQKKQRYNIYDKADTVPLVINVKMQGQTTKEIERGYYKVFKIDTFPKFYLIFVENNVNRNTIYSEKSTLVKGQRVNVDSTYFFELSCKDTLWNGTCIPTKADITYFGKYLGFELGKLSTAKNLIGLIIPDIIDIHLPSCKDKILK